MRGFKKIISFVLAITMVFGMIFNPVSVQAAEGTSAYVADLLGYYKTYQEAAATDIERVLSEMKSVDEAAGEAWENIMNYWSDVNAEGFENIDTVPEGLPEDNSMAVVILGFALNPDGTMKEELIGRLQAGLNVANAYENCYVVVTGGGTAANNKDVTEGGLMGEWLLAQGLDEDRLIVENRAPSTVGNAQYTYEILKEKYPQVNSVVLVTSDYHIPRGCIIYYSKFVLDALRTGQEPLTIISNAGNNTGSNGYESISLQASGVSQVAGIAASSSVTLSVLDTITVSQDAAYVEGEELAITVNASYDSSYVRNVSDLVEVTDFDPALGEDQSVTVTYTENGVTIKGKFALSETEKTINAYAMKLEKLIAEADVNRALYTDSSLEILDLAVENAEAVLSDGKATDEDVLVATETLNKAVAALKERENVALKKPVTASVNSANAYKITDGNLGSYWETLEGGKNIPVDESYFVIDLQGIYDVDTIKAVPYFKGEERYYHYDISVSTDNENWEKVAEQRSTEDTLEAVINGKSTENVYSNSNKTVTESYVVIELMEKSQLESFRVVTYSKSTANWYNWEIFVSDDNATWTSVGKYETASNPGYPGITITLEEPVSAKYVKVQGLATNNKNDGLHLVEVEAYGTMAENIAKGKPTTVNKYSSNNGATAVDGNISSYWDSDTTWAQATEADYPCMILDLEGVYELDLINVMNYHSTSRYYQYEIYTSVDGEEYTPFAEKKDEVNSGFSRTFDAEGTTARYLKYVGTKNSANSGFHLNELTVTGTLVLEEAADYSAVEAAIESAVAALELIPVVTPTPDPTPEVTPTPEPEPVPEVFPDVKEGSWYVPGVQFVYDNGLMSGSNGLFNPTADITRAQLVTTLYRLAGEPAVTEKSALTDFSDVAEGKYYTDAVCWAYETGVTTGTDGKFNPTDKLTRQQMAAFFFRYLMRFCAE